MECSRTRVIIVRHEIRSNNTNKWNAQEQCRQMDIEHAGSNNTNKWNAQEQCRQMDIEHAGSNNTNKWNAQEQGD